ncbi:MAG: DedA family protein [Ktedonobacterales bacterium]
MINSIVASLGHIPAAAVYLFVFAWLAAESCGVPLPNELVLLLAGSLAAQQGHGLSGVLLVIVAVLGSLAGAMGAYTIGMRGGREAVIRFGSRFGLDSKRLDGIEHWFQRRGPVAIFLARITPFVRTVASFPAGVLRLPQRSFLIATALGSLVWCTVMVVLGVALGANYTIALRLIEQYTIPAIIVLVALGAGYFWLHRRLERVAETIEEGGDPAAHEPEARRLSSVASESGEAK